MHLTDEQKKQLIGIALTAFVVLIVQVAGVLGIDVLVPRLLTTPPADENDSGEIAVMSAGAAGYQCGPGAGACLIAKYGRGISVYSDNGSTSKFSVAGASGNTVIAGTLAVTGAASFSANPLFPSESITPTNGGTITPSKALVTLTPAGPVGVDLGPCTTGQHTVLYNSINANVVITDTGNGILAGSQTLGQYDALPLVCIASKWVQTGAVSAN